MKKINLFFCGPFSILCKIRKLKKYTAEKRLTLQSKLNVAEIIVITGYCIDIALTILGLPLYTKIIPLCMINHQKVVILLQKIREYIKNKKK